MSMPISFVMQLEGAETVKSQIHGVADTVRSTGDQMEQSTSKTEKLTSAFSKFAGTAGQITTVASSATALVFQWDALGDAALRVEKAENRLTSSRASFISAQEQLNKLVDKGITSGPQYEEALLRVQAAEERMTIATKDVEQATGDMTKAQLQFGLQVIPTVLTSVTTFQNIGLKGLSLGFSGISKEAPFAAQGLGKFATATRIAQFAMGPFGLVMIGATTLFTMFATNAFGMRDALDSFAKKVEEVLPFLKPVFDFFRSIASALFPDVENATTSMQNTMSDQFNIISSSATTMQSSLAEQFRMAEVGISEMGGTFTTKLGEVSGGFTSMTDTAKASMDEITKSVKAGVDKVVDDLDILKSRLSDAQLQTYKALKSVAPSTAEAFVKATAGGTASTLTRLINRGVPSPIGYSGFAGTSGKKATTTTTTTTTTTRTRTMAHGGIIDEPVFGIGLMSGKNILLGERGPEAVVPLAKHGVVFAGGTRERVIERVIERVPVILEADGKEIARLVNKKLS